MKSIIVGTAGHIDHGKTALVKALTGIDADRLEEEKRRGITIDIGFAHLQLSDANDDPLRLGFVDVPGHEKFVRNMLAGVGGIDLVLLVVAADEGIKPQTREHFDICRMLSIPRGITVLTKTDTVDAETLEVVRAEVRDFVHGSFLEKSPIMPVSALTGVGLEELTRELSRLAQEVPAKNEKANFRLPIDRVFSIKGFGTVITGTLIAGSVSKEDEVEVFPSGKTVRVRGVQVHGEDAAKAIAGERTALNLSGVTTADLARGMTLARRDLLRATKTLDVRLTLLPSAKLLKNRARVHFHAFTSETIAEVVLYEEKQIGLGQSGLAQLRLAEPVLLLPGDRFIIRQFSPVTTIGGGVVVDAAPLAPSRNRKQSGSTPKFLQVLQNGTPREVLFTRILRRGTRGLKLGDALSETGWTASEVAAHATALLKSADEDRVVKASDTLVAASSFSQARDSVIATLDGFHRANPLVNGISSGELREKVALNPNLFAALIDSLSRERKLEVSGEAIRLTGRGVVMKDEEAESKRTIEQAFASAGLKVPALKEVLASLPVDKVRAQKIVTLLLRDRVLVKLSDELIFHRDALTELRSQIAAIKTKSPKIDVAGFKDLTGVSRKYAIPLLEYLDRERVTRRVGDERVIL
jgi:selenocysteine-specific elongation factor